MEAIKCPNCGSEKVKELTEEKYECLACENVFLVHSLSKEFRKTDEHISQIHADLKNMILQWKNFCHYALNSLSHIGLGGENFYL